MRIRRAARIGRCSPRPGTWPIPITLAQVLLICCFVRHLLRDGPGVVELAEELIPLSTEQGFPYWLGMATILKGWALTRAEERERGMDLMRQGLTTYRATGAENWVPYFLALLAGGCRQLDQPVEATGPAGRGAGEGAPDAGALVRSRATPAEG